jgi:probable HAF family extracellular repeat protein
MKKFFVLCGWAALAAVTIAFIGCGGGSTSAPPRLPVVQTPQPPTPTPTAPPPPPSPVVPAKHYQVIDLAPLSGATDCQANAISGSHHAAGYSVFWSGGVGTARATFWHDGAADDLGSGEASAINSSDLIVGFVLQSNGTPHATLWDHGLVTDLGLLTGFDSSLATGINDSGEVVGIAYSFANPNNEVGFKWNSQTGMQAIDGAATASGINNNGDIAGMTQNLQAAIFTASGTITLLGTLGDFSLAGAVNNQGHAVGYSPLVAGGHVDAFFYNGTMQDLGTLQAGSNTLAVSVNDNDLVIGVSNLAGHALPFVFSVTTGMVDLNSLIAADSGWELATASGIDQDGRIVGAGVVSGAVHGFLLTPEN